MPNPAIQDVHIDSALTDMSVAYMQDADDFIADKVFPVVGVKHQSNKFFVYNKGDFFRAAMERRAPGTESAGGGFKLTTQSYSADVWALHKDIDNQTEANYDDPLNADTDATDWLSQQALISKDVQWVAKNFATSIWTGDQTGVASGPIANQFLQFNQAGSTPFKTIRAQKYVVKGRTGYFPNTLVMGAQVWQILADHADLLSRIAFGTTGDPSITDTALMAKALGIERVIVANGIQNTAVEGQTDAFSFIAGKNMLFCYSAPNPGLMVPSAGYTFTWTGLEGAGAFGNNIGTIQMPWIKSRRVEMEMAYDMNIVAADLGVFFSAAVA